LGSPAFGAPFEVLLNPAFNFGVQVAQDGLGDQGSDFGTLHD
jgi:hypothetical protein